MYLSIYLSACLFVYLSIYLSLLSFCRTPLDIGTSKSGPKRMCFVHFDLQICFSLQRRAIFAHPNFKKWSEHGVFCAFGLANVLLATAVCSFQSVYSHKSSELRKEALSSYVKFRCTQTVMDLKVSSSRAVNRTSNFCKYSAFFPCARCKQQSGAYWQGLVPHAPRQSFIAKFVYKQNNPTTKTETTDFWLNLHPGKLTWAEKTAVWKMIFLFQLGDC